MAATQLGCSMAALHALQQRQQQQHGQQHQHALAGSSSMQDVGRHMDMLAAALESIEGRSAALAKRLAAAEAEAATYRARLVETQDTLARTASQLESSTAEQAAQRREVGRLTALLDAAQLQAALSTEQLAADLQDERRHAERLRSSRDDALLERDTALLELADAFTDINLLQATLADSALYVRQLRGRIAHLELAQEQWEQQQAAHSQQQAAQRQQADRQRDQNHAEGVFSMAAIKASVEAAVAAAAQEPEEERRRRIRQLQLRWHPDKNPVLQEVATEVTKLINEAVSKLHKE